MRVQIAQGDVDLLLVIDRCGYGYLVNRLAPMLVGTAFQFGWQQHRILMDGKHLEDMIRRGQDHPVILGQDDRLQHIDQLGDIGHPDTVAVVVEQIQVDRRHDGIADGVLLIKKTRIGARLDIIPGSPLIDDQADFFLWVKIGRASWRVKV